MTDTDHSTTSEAQATDEASERDQDRMLYATDRLTLPLAFAAIEGARQGLLTRADLPLEMPDGPAFLAAAHKVLDECGARAARAAQLQLDARVADCPWWCHGRHPAVYDTFMGIDHTLPVGEVILDDGEPEAGKVEVYIAASESDTGNIDAPVISAGRMPENLSAGGSRLLSQLLQDAADRLDEITAAASD